MSAGRPLAGSGTGTATQASPTSATPRIPAGSSDLAAHAGRHRRRPRRPVGRIDVAVAVAVAVDHASQLGGQRPGHQPTTPVVVGDAHRPVDGVGQPVGEDLQAAMERIPGGERGQEPPVGVLQVVLPQDVRGDRAGTVGRRALPTRIVGPRPRNVFGRAAPGSA